MTAADAPALAVDSLAKTFASDGRRVEALRGVSLQAPTGAITGLIGPDGAGKTTLMRLVAGLLRPDAGAIRVLDIDAVAQPLVVQSRVGYMPQRFGLYEDLTVGENLDLYADLQGVPPAERSVRYRELTRMTALAPFTGRLAGKLSGGMKQKLGLACTLLSRPRLLLLDEPTVGVDPVSRRELWQIVRRMVDDEGMTVLLSTAYLDEAERCHAVTLLHEGRVLGSGDPARFREAVAQRTYGVEVHGMTKRAAQSALIRVPGVQDALVEGERVRLLTAEPRPPAAHELPAALREARIEAIEPRFEDGFVATLHEVAGDATGSASEAADAHPPEDATAQAATPPPGGPSGGPSGTPKAGTGPSGTPKAGTADDAVIRVERLSRRFGDFYAVRDIDFAVARGEVFGLLGANGAGKTTTFRMLCGLLPPSSGDLSVAGLDLRRAAAAGRARIGYMSQKFSLYGNLSVGENLTFFASAYGLRGRHRRARIDWALTELGLSDYARAASAELPLGFKQRLALACALMHEPEILFLDEPTSGVDPLARREFWRRINALAEAGVTVMVTTHFMQEAEYCDRLAVMAAGEILALDTPAGIKRRAQRRERPAPSMEDAFIALIEDREAEDAA